ncbi:glycosyltransferase family 2 protein [Asticcacaulis solisilvae]|uniref:glycosyltransferase family 2 protein n=1 Tax=Asticcacaulis solisilvae TaxID=1217274 RepID=UPI003FD81CEF
MTTFSIIVLAYKSAAYVDRCLNALIPFNVEIILADNGSGDLDFDALKTRYPTVKCLPFSENLGFAAGNNRAAEAATGDWLGFINPDAFADSGWLDAMTTAITSWPYTSMFTSLQVDAANPSRMDGAGDGMTFFGFPYRAGFGQTLPAQLNGKSVFSPCGAAFVIRRDLFRQLGGFDERFFCYCEDADLGARARLLGHNCRLVPEAKVAHIGSASTGVRSDFALYHGYRNRLWLYAKTMPLLLLIPTLPIHTGLTLLGAVKDTLNGKGSLVWRALGDACKGMGPILRSRTQIQRERQIGALRLAKVLTWNPLKIIRRSP